MYYHNIILYDYIYNITSHCTMGRSSTGNTSLVIRDTTRYRFTTAFQEEFRVQNILILDNHFLVPPELPSFLILMKEGKF